jgi:hypothetical protein
MRRGTGSGRTRGGEEGSALLIVFLFAAIVAIMLYKAMPGVVFEGQRQKEQLLIDRGDEYKHAIKLFYMRNKTYPTSLEQLDNFNNVRYIRRRFKDPMTGKKDWRLIHVMGPGFVLTDSKVTPPPMQNGQSGSSFNTNSNQSGFGQSGSQSSFGQSSFGQSGFGQSNSNQSGFGQSNSNQSGFGQSNSNRSGFGQSNSSQSSFGQSGFGQSGFGQSSSMSNNQMASGGSPAGTAMPTGPDGQPVPTAAQIYGAKRRPAATSDAYEAAQQNGENSQDSNPDQPLPMPGDPDTRQMPGQNAGTNNSAMSQGNNPGFGGGMNGAPGANGQPGNQTNPNNNGQPGNPADPNNGQPGSPALDAVNGALRRQTPLPTRSSTSRALSSFGSIPSGAIAGVASTVEGSSIKTVDKQTDYSKWEFVYNPQQEAAAGMMQAMQGMGGQGMNQNGQQPSSSSSFGAKSSSFNNSGNNSSGNSTSGFGNNSSSGFGNNSSSGFGNNSTSGFGSNSNSGFGSKSNSGFGNKSNSGFGGNSSQNSSGFGSNSSPRQGPQ